MTQARPLVAHLKRPATWLGILLTLFLAYFIPEVCLRHANFFSSQFDLGNMDQVLWQSLHGRWFQMMDPGGAILVSRAGIHADFLLLIYMPLYAIWHSPVVLIVAQVVAVASGAIPLYLLARHKVSSWFALIISGLYLLYPPMHWAILFDVHAVVLVTPIFLWAWWAVDQRRWWWAGALLALALLAKEEIGLVVALNGVYWLWQKKTRLLGLISLVVGLSWSAFAIGWIIPHARHAPGHFALGYYAAYGSTTSEIIKTMLTKPWIIVQDLLGPGRPHYYGSLLMPAGLLAVIGLPVFLIALPELMINALSSDPNMQTIFFQYTSAITPFIFLAAVFGWSWWNQRFVRLQKEWWTPKTSGRVLIAVLIIGLFSVWRWAPVPGSRFSQDALQAWHRSPYRNDVANIQRLVKPEDKIAVTNNLAPHFTQRDAAWGFPGHLEQADGIIVLEGGQFELRPAAEINQRVAELLKDPSFTLAYHRQDIYYFQRVK